MVPELGAAQLDSAREAGACAPARAADARRRWSTARIAAGILVGALVAGVALAVLWIDGAGFHALFPDGYAYSSLALNVLQGKGYVGPDLATPFTVRPVFPLILAGVFRLLGPSESSAIVAARLIFVLLLTLIFFFSRKLFSIRAAVISILLILTSYRFNNWLTLVHLDYLTPLSQLLYVYVLYAAFAAAQPLRQSHDRKGVDGSLTLPALSWLRLPSKQSTALFALAGLMLGVAFLIKETALLFLPLPVLWTLWRKESRRREFIVLNAVSLAAFAAVVFPWLAYIYLTRGQQAAAVGRAAQSLPGLILQANGAGAGASYLQIAQSLLLEVLASPLNYYTLHLQSNFVLAPLLLLAFAVIVWRAIRGDKSSQYLLLCTLAFLPILVLQGLVGLRSRQSIYFFILAFVALGQALALLGGWLIPRAAARRSLLVGLATALLAASVILFQFYGDAPQSTFSFVKQYSFLYRLLSGAEIDAPPTRREVRMGNWLQENLPAGSRLMVRDAYTSILGFVSGGQFPFYSIPMHAAKSLTTAPFPETRDDLIVFNIDAYGNHNVLDVLDTFIFAISERELIDTIVANDIDYVVLTSDRDTGLLYYFLNHPDFAKIGPSSGSEGDFYHVFHRLAARPRLIHGPLALGDGFVALFHRLQAEYPAVAAALIRANFKQMLGWSDDEVQLLLDGEHPGLGAMRQFTYDRYAQFIQDYDRLDAARAAALRQSAMAPLDAWPYISLAYLAQAAAATEPDRRAAAAYLFRAFTLEEDNTLVRNGLLRAYAAYGPEGVPTDLLDTLVRQYESAALAPTGTADDFVQLANVYSLIGNRAGAMSVCRQLIDRQATSAGGYLCLADLYRGEGRIGDVVAVSAAALQDAALNSGDLQQIMRILADLPPDTAGLADLLALLDQQIARRDDYALQLALGNLYLTLGSSQFN